MSDDNHQSLLLDLTASLVTSPLRGSSRDVYSHSIQHTSKMIIFYITAITPFCLILGTVTDKICFGSLKFMMTTGPPSGCRSAAGKEVYS
jgi:hypothetical protein